VTLVTTYVSLTDTTPESPSHLHITIKPSYSFITGGNKGRETVNATLTLKSTQVRGKESILNLETSSVHLRQNALGNPPLLSQFNLRLLFLQAPTHSLVANLTRGKVTTATVRLRETFLVVFDSSSSIILELRPCYLYHPNLI